MRRRIVFGLCLVAVVALVSVATFADDSYLATPHAVIGPHFHEYMVVRNDLKGSEQKPAPPPIMKDIPAIDSSAAGKSSVGRMSTGNVLMATASPEMLLENRLRSLAHEMR
ncbi:MAG TPA: hypothetical protein VFV19_14165 [Candidatus Polarisedimenticolaceae bacterium]|nr:hypothetical protein [Candidatus Polarisedimenticolaceae bacterium]